MARAKLAKPAKRLWRTNEGLIRFEQAKMPGVESEELPAPATPQPHDMKRIIDGSAWQIFCDGKSQSLTVIPGTELDEAAVRENRLFDQLLRIPWQQARFERQSCQCGEQLGHRMGREKSFALPAANLLQPA